LRSCTFNISPAPAAWPNRANKAFSRHDVADDRRSETYRRGAESWWEVVRAENTLQLAIAGRAAAVPRAEKPDFLSGGVGHASRHRALRSRTMLV
jgi:hypothetical protein